MKRIFYLITVTILLFVYGCSKDKPIIETINTDISVTSSKSLILWLDDNDLIQKINNALTGNGAKNSW